MRRLAVWAGVLGILAMMAASASGVWIWRDGRWEYIKETEPKAPPPEGKQARPSDGGQAPETPSEPQGPEVGPPPVAPSPAREEPGETEPPSETTEAPPAPKETPAEAVGPKEPAAEEAPEVTSEPQRPWWRRLRRPKDPNADRTLFEQGREALSAGRHSAAARNFKRLIKDFPESEYRAEAMWLRAEALFAEKDYYKAFEQYEDLISGYAGSPHYREALEREIEIAETYLGPTRRRVWGIPLLSGDTEAIEILRRVCEHQPTGDLAERSLLRIADYYRDKRLWQEAEDYYNRYCREHPNGPDVVRAELERAKSTIEKCKGARYDTSSLALARDRLRQFQQKYPEAAQQEGVAELLESLHNMQAQALYEIAAYYHRAGQPLAAAYYAEQVQEQFSDTPWSQKAQDLLGEMTTEKEKKP